MKKSFILVILVVVGILGIGIIPHSNSLLYADTQGKQHFQVHITVDESLLEKDSEGNEPNIDINKNPIDVERDITQQEEGTLPHTATDLLELVILGFCILLVGCVLSFIYPTLKKGS